MKCSLGGIAILLFFGAVGLAAASANTVPIVYQPLRPTRATPGGRTFTMTVKGSGFVSGSVVKWNGHSRTTKFVSSEQLQATILATDIANRKTASVTVVSPAPGGGTSNVVFFPVSTSLASVTLKPVSCHSVFTGPMGITVGDFNQDGNTDLAVATGLSDINPLKGKVTVLLGQGNGSFLRSDFLIGQNKNPFSIVTADVNHDGKSDLAVSNLDGTVAVLLGNGNGTFQAAKIFNTGPNPRAMAAADFNGDGNLDLVTGNGGGSVSVLLGNGDGTFGAHTEYATTSGSDVWSVVVGDFNHDGNLDLASGNDGGNETGSVSVLLGNGNGTFQTHHDYTTSSDNQGLVVADFDKDGNLDLAAANHAAGNLSIFKGMSDGTFATPLEYATSIAPLSMTTGDFNSDGQLDLATASVSDKLSILLGKAATFPTHTDYGTSSHQPQSLMSADFNNNGRLDFVFAAYFKNVVCVASQ